jgi:hypothetical protein
MLENQINEDLNVSQIYPKIEWQVWEQLIDILFF